MCDLVHEKRGGITSRTTPRGHWRAAGVVTAYGTPPAGHAGALGDGTAEAGPDAPGSGVRTANWLLRPPYAASPRHDCVSNWAMAPRSRRSRIRARCVPSYWPSAMSMSCIMSAFVSRQHAGCSTDPVLRPSGTTSRAPGRARNMAGSVKRERWRIAQSRGLSLSSPRCSSSPAQLSSILHCRGQSELKTHPRLWTSTLWRCCVSMRCREARLAMRPDTPVTRRLRSASLTPSGTSTAASWTTDQSPSMRFAQLGVSLWLVLQLAALVASRFHSRWSWERPGTTRRHRAMQ